jgi:hypothetical protein
MYVIEVLLQLATKKIYEILLFRIAYMLRSMANIIAMACEARKMLVG